jgi:hypothetical protein
MLNEKNVNLDPTYRFHNNTTLADAIKLVEDLKPGNYVSLDINADTRSDYIQKLFLVGTHKGYRVSITAESLRFVNAQEVM